MICHDRVKILYISKFIPGSLQAVSQVDANGEHGQCGGFDDELAAVAVDVLRPTEGAFFKPFCDEPISSSIEVEDLDESAGFVREEEGRATEGIETEVVACERGEGVEALAHVAGFERDIDFKVGVEGEHGG